MNRAALQRDRAANLAVLAGIGSAIGLTVAVISLLVPTGYAGRSDPLYWLLMLPVVVWAWAAVAFRPWALRVLPVVLAGIPVTTVLLVIALPGSTRADRVTLWIVAGLSLVLGLAGWRWRGQSALNRCGDKR